MSATDQRMPPSAPNGSTGRLLHSAVNIGLLLAIGFVLFVGYGLVNNRWYHVIAVQGSSMAPTIMSGDLIVITRPPEEVEEGMVLTLQVDTVLVTHRVVGVRPDGSFMTQGDANTVRDDFSENKVRIVGVYRFRIPMLGGLLSPGSGAFFANRLSIPVTGQIGTEAVVDAQGWVTPVSTVSTVDALNTDSPAQTEAPSPAPPTASPVPTPGETPSASPTPSPSAEASPSPAATSTPSPDLPSPSPTPAATPPPSPVETESPSPTPTPDETPSATPSPIPS
jgi:signal peptidase I